MPQWEAHDEATAPRVLGVECEGAIHQHDDTTAKEQSKTKTFREHINLSELFENEVSLVGRNTKTRVFDGEVHITFGSFDTHGQTALASEVQGIDE